MSDGMGMLEAAFMGLVQGLTEFLPISSSAHIRIFGELTGNADPGAAFTAMIQIGTELAVLAYFRRDIVRIVVAWWRALWGAHGPGWRNRVGLGPKGGKATTADLDGVAYAGPGPAAPARAGSSGLAVVSHDALMGWFIIVGSVPIVVLGLAFQNQIESTLRNLWFTVAALALFALLLGWADSTRAQERTLERLTWRHALWYGLWQSLALIPGVSRSGGTITGGRLMGYTREAAARYSFLLAMPAVFGSGLYQVAKTVTGSCHTPGAPGAGAIVLATAVAFFVGYVVIIGFLKIVSTYSYKAFVWYRLVLAVVVAVLLLTGVLHAGGTVPACPGG